MSQTILITGGAGFIGSHVADLLLRRGDHVRVLDSLTPQVHGPSGRAPEYLDPDVELIVGDVRDADAVAGALRGVDKVCHLAAAVGVGQSMYQIDRYVSVNSFGTSVLLQALTARPVARLVVASSMSIYGEGCYVAPSGAYSLGCARSQEQLKRKDWAVRNRAGEVLLPVATPEDKTPALSSVYALSKYDQERLCLLVGDAYHIPTLALRFFNVYGPRQALSNPYTGVLAIFASRLLNRRAPVVFEDGEQRRDFVSVHDVAAACLRALDAPPSISTVLNIGSGRNYSVREVALSLARVLGKPQITPEVTGAYRVGDIRHCFADIEKARAVLQYAPAVDFEAGLTELSGWLAHEVAVDRIREAREELAMRGLSA